MAIHVGSEAITTTHTGRTPGTTHMEAFAVLLKTECFPTLASLVPLPHCFPVLGMVEGSRVPPLVHLYRVRLVHVHIHIV